MGPLAPYKCCVSLSCIVRTCVDRDSTIWFFILFYFTVTLQARSSNCCGALRSSWQPPWLHPNGGSQMMSSSQRAQATERKRPQVVTLRDIHTRPHSAGDHTRMRRRRKSNASIFVGTTNHIVCEVESWPCQMERCTFPSAELQNSGCPKSHSGSRDHLLGTALRDVGPCGQTVGRNAVSDEPASLCPKGQTHVPTTVNEVRSPTISHHTVSHMR